MNDLGEVVGLSESAACRRVVRLPKGGYILADVSLIDPVRIGITMITAVRFAKEGRETYDAFKQEIACSPEITRCFIVTGDEDFILIGHFSDTVSSDDWVNARILPDPAISRSTTHLVFRRVKFETAIPV
jgi:Lrp/AsnC family leucine-responsive transcriptional regulator